MKVAVLGSGFSGLVATKHAIEAGLDVQCFEQNDEVGGIWIYNEESGVQSNGRVIHSTIYQNLRSNLPKELMEFPDFKFEGIKVRKLCIFIFNDFIFICAINIKYIFYRIPM